MTEPRNERLLNDLRARVAATEPVRAILRRPEERVSITGLAAEARALVATVLRGELGRKLAVIVPGDANLSDLTAAFRLFHSDPLCVGSYPNPSLSPYQEIPPSLAVVRDEIRALSHIVDASLDIVLIPARALMRRLPRACRLVKLLQEGTSTGHQVRSRCSGGA